MKNVAVLGIGNRLLMDDGIGVYIVEGLQKQDMSSGINYIVGETDIDYCMDKIKGTDYLIIIDAARLGNPPGHITVFELHEAAATKDIGLTMHNLHLFDMLVFTNNKLKGIMIGIEPYTIDYNFGLSTELSTRLEDIIEKAQDIIKHSLL